MHISIIQLLPPRVSRLLEALLRQPPEDRLLQGSGSLESCRDGIERGLAQLTHVSRSIGREGFRGNRLPWTSFDQLWPDSGDCCRFGQGPDAEHRPLALARRLWNS